MKSKLSSQNFFIVELEKFHTISKSEDEAIVDARHSILYTNVYGILAISAK